MTATPILFLASASPRRVELLAQLGLQPTVLRCEVSEIRAADESPLQYSRRVALDKALAGWAQLHDRQADAVVLGADTEVVLDGAVLGKPQNDADAHSMLRRLAGRTHQVLSSVAVVTSASRRVLTSLTEVRFASLSDAQIARYLASGEHHGKAGSYAIQGRAAAFVERIEGSYSGVMGLPLRETAQLLTELDVTAD
jgi:septum formation protein